MIGTVACALDLPLLGEAASARGLRLIPFARDVEAQAAVFGCCGDPAQTVGQARGQGWRGLLMLVVPEGASVAGALDAGADDAVSAVASASEMAARLAARVRGHASPLHVGALRIDWLARRAQRQGRDLGLGAREFALLAYLAQARGRYVARAELLGAVWGLGFDPGTNVVEVHVSRLRAKLDRGEAHPMLQTVRGRGYALIA